jgi:hypothetical protein
MNKLAASIVMSKKCIKVIAAIVCTAVIVAACVLWFLYARLATTAKECIQNLGAIDSAKQQWAIETISSTNAVPIKRSNPASVHAIIEGSAITNAVPTWDDLRPALENVIFALGGKLPECPQGGTYTIGRVADAARCSISNHNEKIKGSLHTIDTKPARE